MQDLREGGEVNNLDLYIHFVHERYAIYLARQEGRPQPWTEDPVLASKKFTNVFRVLDPGSQFIFGLDTEDPLDVVTRCVLYRMTNLPATWDAIHTELGRYPTVEDVLEMDRLVSILKAHRDSGNRVFSGAYIIIPEPGTANDKVEGAVRAAKWFAENAAEGFLAAETQEQRFQALQSAPGMGKFLSMQVLTDWGYLQDVDRENDFIIAGPGARRGAAHLGDIPAERIINILTRMWEAYETVLLNGRPPSLMDVQNTLCEFSKYHRFTVGGKAYRRTPYSPDHPGKQPMPILPTWAG